jgi:hypothetical protein
MVRLGNTTLQEFLAMSKEIFEHGTFPEGSILRYGSVSHLSRACTSLHASRWTSLVVGGVCTMAGVA